MNISTTAAFHRQNTGLKSPIAPNNKPLVSTGLSSDHFSVYFGNHNRPDNEARLRQVQKEIRELQYSDPLTIYSPVSLFPLDGEAIVQHLNNGKTIKEAFALEDLEGSLSSRRPQGPFPLQEHMENYVRANARLKQLKAEAASLRESVGHVSHPEFKIPNNQAELDRLVEQLRRHFNNDPAWYEGIRFIKHGGTDFVKAARQAGQKISALNLEFLVRPMETGFLTDQTLYHGTSATNADKVGKNGFSTMQGHSLKELGNALYLTDDPKDAANYALQADRTGGTVLQTTLPNSFCVGQLSDDIGTYFQNGITRAVTSFLTQDDPTVKPDPQLLKMLRSECMKRFFTDRGYDAVFKSGSTAQLHNQQPYVAVFQTKGLTLKPAYA